MNHLCGLDNMKCLSSISTDDAIALEQFRETYNARCPSDMPKNDEELLIPTWYPNYKDLPSCGWRPLDDLTLYRFLCADRNKNGKFQQDISLDRLLQTINYRREQKADEILEAILLKEQQQSDALLVKLLPNLEKYKRVRIRVFTGRDYSNQPVLFERLGEFISLGNYSQFTIEEWVKYYVWDLERHFVEMRKCAADNNKSISTFTIFLDAHGITSPRNAMKVIPLLKALTKAVEKFYPEIAERIIIFRIPRIMSFLYRAVRVFLDPVTAEKIRLHPGIPLEKEFLKHIPIEAIPEEYGGKSNVHFPQTATN